MVQSHHKCFFFHMVRAGAYWHKIHDIHACAFAEHTKSPLFRLDFFFGSSCQDIVNAEKPKFCSSTVVSFTLEDFLGNR